VERSASAAASGEAVTPAAQITVPVATRSTLPRGPRISTPSVSTPTTVRATSGVTPSSLSERAARSDNGAGKDWSKRDPASTSRTRASRGPMERKASGSVSRASSAIRPATSTPVGPPPTTTNVNQRSPAAASCSTSAASNAFRIRDRTRSALSSDLTSSATSRHSSCPKYEYLDPPATMSVSYGAPRRRPRVEGSPGAFRGLGPSPPPSRLGPGAAVERQPAAARRSRPARACRSPPGRSGAGTGGSCCDRRG
jgi:hypothetical protein